MDNFEEQEEEQAAGGGFQAELLQSYVSFLRRAVRSRWRVSALVLAVGTMLTVAATVYWPRTYACTTVLMASGTGVLESRDGSPALAGAADLILRHENLEEIIRDTGLVQKARQRRPALLHLKDRIFAAAFGEMDDKTQTAALLGTLQSKIDVSTEKGDLSVKVEWSDPVTSADVAEAARQSFVKARHTAEISAFEEKMTILDGHSIKLREDIGALAAQLKAARDKQIAQAREERSQVKKAADPDVPVQHFARRSVIEPDAQLPALKDKLEAQKAKLALAEADRDKRIREEQAKYDDMKLKLTSAHPEVVTQSERVAMASQVPSELALMRAEVKDLEGAVRQRESVNKQGNDLAGLGGILAGSSKSAAAEPLPAEITDLLERDNLDPALSAQLSGAVTTYGSLRNDMVSTRIDLDTAQAAFNHRYQVIIPAEVPTKAEKPKAAAILGGGLVFSLLIALLLPLFFELRTGIIVERWQVAQLQLPVLAEVRLPPHSPS
jgi:uncharacterized protein involved in exopolysaccharide biosynthesis